MKKKTVFGISFALASMLLLSTVAMANQSVQGTGAGGTMTGSAQTQNNEDLAAKILNRSPYNIRQLVARGLTLEELLIAEGKYEEYKNELQKMNAAGEKDKSVVIEIGDHGEREDGMVVRIIASLDEKTDDKVKVELTGLSDKSGSPEKSKCVVLDSKKGKVDVWVMDGKEGGYQSFSSGYADKNQLGVQTGNMPYTTNRGGTDMNTMNAGYGGAGTYTGTTGGATGYTGAGAGRGANTGYGNTGAYTGTTGYTGAGAGGGTNTGYGGTGTTTGATGYTGAGAGGGTNTGYGGTGTTTGATGYTGAGAGRGANAGYGGGMTGYQGTGSGRGMGSTGGAGSATGYTTGASSTVSAMSVSNGTYYPTESRILGLTQTQLKTALDNGSTIYSLMSAAGKLNEYKEELVTQNKATFNKALSEGKFDKQTADKMREYFEQKISSWDGTTPIDMFKIKVG